MVIDFSAWVYNLQLCCLKSFKQLFVKQSLLWPWPKQTHLVDDDVMLLSFVIIMVHPVPVARQGPTPLETLENLRQKHFHNKQHSGVSEVVSGVF